MITSIAGGVGAAKLLEGALQVVDPAETTVIVNTGDDTIMHGLHVSPDIDTLVYTLAGASNRDTGWGLAGESWQAMRTLARYGGPTWFRLGDRDLGTHLYRTGRLLEGASLSEVTSEIARSWGLGLRLLPMSDEPVRTMVRLADSRGASPGGVSARRPEEASEGGEISFQDYFVRLHHEVPVASLRFDGAESARPAPGVLDAITCAEVVVICPSNPLVSIGPVLGVPGIAEAIASRRDRTVAVSPIVGGRALKGPADRMLAELGHESSALGVARIYAPYASTLVIDEVDRPLSTAVEELGMACVVTRTIMGSSDVAAELFEVVLSSVG